MNEHSTSRIIKFICDLTLTLLFYFSPRKNRIIFMSSYIGDYTSNSKYLFEELIKQNTKHDIKFIVNDKKTRERLIQSIGNYFISNKGIKKKIYCLNAKYWVCSYFDMPVQGVLLSFRRTVLHLGHGIPVKSSGLLENNPSLIKKIYYLIVRTNITYHYASTNYVSKILSQMFGCNLNKFIIASQPRVDFLPIVSSKKINQNENLRVLYAPTWRRTNNDFFDAFSENEISNFIEKLKILNIDFVYRPHPLFKLSKIDTNNLKISSTDNEPEISDFLSTYDMLITDYSSICIDYLTLNRPIIIFDYDYTTYKNYNGFCFNFDEFNPGEKVKTLDELFKAINYNLLNIESHNENRLFLNEKFNGKHRNSLDILIRDILND